MVFDPVNLNEVVEELKQLELSVVLEETNATIEVPQPLPEVLGDFIQIRQLLQNLTANGLKYRQEQVPPRIEIHAEQSGPETLKVRVCDNGIGIAPASQQAVFDMFKRLNPRSKYEGSGIGLAVCKKIVARHSGQIGVESQLGQGSTFWFTIPLAKQVQEPTMDTQNTAAEQLA